jgi:hypothetical protein
LFTAYPSPPSPFFIIYAFPQRIKESDELSNEAALIESCKNQPLAHPTQSGAIYRVLNTASSS